MSEAGEPRRGFAACDRRLERLHRWAIARVDVTKLSHIAT